MTTTNATPLSPSASSADLTPAQQAVTQHLSLLTTGRIQDWVHLFASDGVLELPYAPAGMATRTPHRRRGVPPDRDGRPPASPTSRSSSPSSTPTSEAPSPATWTTGRYDSYARISGAEQGDQLRDVTVPPC